MDQTKLPALAAGGGKDGRASAVHSKWERHSHHAGLPPYRRSSRVRDDKETLSTSRGRQGRHGRKSLDSGRAVPRLTDRELRAIPRSELVALIQVFGSPS